MSGIQMALLGSAGKTLKVTASNVSGSASGFAASGSVNTIGSSTNTTASGGTSPYTYAWTFVSQTSGNTPSISNSAIQNPYWTVVAVDGTPSESTWRVTVTDSAAATASYIISVSLEWIDIR